MTRLLYVTLALADADHLDALLTAAEDIGAGVAALQGGGAPPVVKALDAFAAAGPEPVRIVPFTVSGPDTGVSWVRRIVGHRVRTRGTLEVEVTALHRDVDGLAVAADESARPVTGREAPLRSAAWEQVPPHDHHVLVCRGPRCNAQGAEEAEAALRAALRERGVLDDGVLVARTGCLFPCNHAPVIVVHPEDSWHTADTPEAVRAIVDSLTDE